MAGDRFDQRTRSAGLERGDYTAGRDSTHAVIPLAIDAASADEGERRALVVAQALGDVVDGLSGVRWIRSHGEAAYAMMVNLRTSLESMTTADRVVLLSVIPDGEIDELRRLLTPPAG